MNCLISLDDAIVQGEVIELYVANNWSSANKPTALMAALRGSHALTTARVDSLLVGLANAISDGSLTVYFSHMLVHPDWHHRGIGRQLMQAMLGGYGSFHQLMLTADGDAVGFSRAG